jgi:putative salt-induced outer membrane protein YdiY
LAMKLSYTATYNAQVPISYQKLNTLAAVNLVYNF